eukprot:TRINITY_DN7224_c0_g1_i1.p1 TRINITY_DN7224_c0_g1~~TRINITY_DN7224_c0_g1_i1.p1  ORF type:complete len:251 (-),score=42.93 TRINITY_DN7224_c0_g1_i1:303-1019(-)
MASVVTNRIASRARTLRPTFYRFSSSRFTRTLYGCRNDVLNTSSPPLPGSLVGASEFRSSMAVQFPLRLFGSNASLLPQIEDSDVQSALKDILGANWDEIPEPVKIDVMTALSKQTDDKAGQEALANAWRAAEAVEQFSGVLESLRMELDELSGSTGERVRPLPVELQGALQAAYKRYSNYLDSFSPDETYLRKKVETELGRHMIFLKMRCSGLDSEWGKVTLIGTSGIAGSFIEHRT